MTSLYATYLEFCRRGELVYQFCRDDGRVVFPPRLVSPGTGSTDLEWRTCAGGGTVYAVTTLHPRDGAPYNVSIIELDEGFRMMSRVEGIDPGAVRIGLRVRLSMVAGDDTSPPHAIFFPTKECP